MILFALLALAASPAHLTTPTPAAAAEQRMDRLAARICGPDGTVDMDPVRGHPQGWPHCNRNGWNGRRYVPLCEGAKASPRRNDPWLNAYSDVRLEDRRISLSDERTNSCD